MIWLWKQFPTEFLYLGIGKEPDGKTGKTSLVIVLAEGYDKEKLEQEPMVDLSYEPYTNQGFYSGDLGQGRSMLRFFL